MPEKMHKPFFTHSKYISGHYQLPYILQLVCTLYRGWCTPSDSSKYHCFLGRLHLCSGGTCELIYACVGLLGQPVDVLLVKHQMTSFRFKTKIEKDVSTKKL
jgi:hypothetical protein